MILHLRFHPLESDISRFKAGNYNKAPTESESISEEDILMEPPDLLSDDAPV